MVTKQNNFVVKVGDKDGLWEQQKLVLVPGCSVGKCSHWHCSPPVRSCKSFFLFISFCYYSSFSLLHVPGMWEIEEVEGQQGMPNSIIKSAWQGLAEACLNCSLEPSGCIMFPGLFQPGLFISFVILVYIVVFLPSLSWVWGLSLCYQFVANSKCHLCCILGVSELPKLIITLYWEITW